MGRRPEINWEPIKALYLAGKTSREISLIFDINDDYIRQKAARENWGDIRKQIKALPPPKDKVSGAKISNKTLDMTTEIDFQSQLPISKGETKSEGKTDAVTRAIRLRNSDSFRERVIVQADKALTTLEKAVVSSVFETDRFAEALTKVERIGARAYGYDREGDHPIVNIGILGSGSEYDPVD